MIAQHYKDMLGSKSVIRQISEWSTARGAEIGYENVFDYSLGNPSVPCPPQFTAACEDLLAHTDPVKLHGYTPTLTLPSARKAVAESLNRRFGMDYTADHIFMTTGAAGALAHAVRCVGVPGQNIVTFAPFSRVQAVHRGRGAYPARDAAAVRGLSDRLCGVRAARGREHRRRAHQQPQQPQRHRLQRGDPAAAGRFF